MNKITRLLIVVTAVLLAGCGSLPGTQPQQPVQVIQQGETQDKEVLKALSDLAEIKEELKQLRNSVEEIQFETENAKRRQQDLFQDLDRRMVSVERNQRVLNPEPMDVLNGEVIVESGSANIDQGGMVTGGSVANQVLVTSSTGSNSSSTAIPSTEQTVSTNQSATLANSQSTLSSGASAAVSLQEQQAYDQAFELLKQSRYEDAIIQFQQLASTWPNSQLADDAYYWMSEARYVNREFEYALSGFRTVVSQYPDSQRVPEALLKVGYIQYDIGAYEDAAETFRDILSRFPGHQVTVSAETRLRRIEQTIQ